MGESPDFRLAYLYTILALSAAGKEVNRENLLELLPLLGLPVEEAYLEALLRLAQMLAPASKKTGEPSSLGSPVLAEGPDPSCSPASSSEGFRLGRPDKTRTEPPADKPPPGSWPQVKPAGPGWWPRTEPAPRGHPGGTRPEPTTENPFAARPEGTPAERPTETSPEASVTGPASQATPELSADHPLPTRPGLEHAEFPGEAEAQAKSDSQLSGRYLYGIVLTDASRSLGYIGLDKGLVYVICDGGVGAIVQACSPRPYVSEDEEVVKKWISTHHEILESVIQIFGTVLPVGFNTIFQSGAGDPDQVVIQWLSENRSDLLGKIERVRGKWEYGVQAFLSPGEIGESLLANDPDLRRTKEEARTKSPGLAYMYTHKLERTLKERIAQISELYFQEFYQTIKVHCEEVRVEKTRPWPDGRQMILNLSCLVRESQVQQLGEDLESLHQRAGVSVRFTGPWPPYSFVSQ